MLLQIICGILAFLTLYSMARNLNLKKQLKICQGYREFSEVSLLNYKKMLFDKAIETDDLELYSKVQEYSEARRVEFLEYIKKVEKLYQDGEI